MQSIIIQGKIQISLYVLRKNYICFPLSFLNVKTGFVPEESPKRLYFRNAHVVIIKC